MIDYDSSTFAQGKISTLFEKELERVKKIAKRAGWGCVILEIALTSLAWFALFYIIVVFLAGFYISNYPDWIAWANWIDPIGLMLGGLVSLCNLCITLWVAFAAKKELLLDKKVEAM